jgi:hypothetical protein
MGWSFDSHPPILERSISPAPSSINASAIRAHFLHLQLFLLACAIALMSAFSNRSSLVLLAKFRLQYAAYKVSYYDNWAYSAAFGVQRELSLHCLNSVWTPIMKILIAKRENYPIAFSLTTRINKLIECWLLSTNFELQWPLALPYMLELLCSSAFLST